jgi:hypothetical protein
VGLDASESALFESVFAADMGRAAAGVAGFCLFLAFASCSAPALVPAGEVSVVESLTIVLFLLAEFVAIEFWLASLSASSSAKKDDAARRESLDISRVYSRNPKMIHKQEPLALL